jgi:hypothetical protein
MLSNKIWSTVKMQIHIKINIAIIMIIILNISYVNPCVEAVDLCCRGMLHFFIIPDVQTQTESAIFI